MTLVLGGAAVTVEAADAAWWENAVFYEIYPRSFQDTNGDGIGDLNGITSRLDYLAELGVEALWITPFSPSPQVDFGYDVSDYEDVDPQFGTLADFDRLLAEAHRRGMRVVTDLVLNHTSDRHRFFAESRAARSSPKRDWYVWRDPVDGKPPNNWYSGFGPAAWTLDPATGQYYYHFFYPQQPDLNWRNPAVEQALFSSVRFWLDRGVDGFRLDAINWLFEDPALRDNPVLPALRPGSATEHEQELKHNRDLPETHGVLRRLRALSDRYPGQRVLIGEIWTPTMRQLVEYYGTPGAEEVQLPFNFFFLQVPKLDAAAFRGEIARAEAALQGRPTTYVLSNHDRPRAYDRYGDGKHGDAIAKLLATLLLTLRGAPFIYYGEEIGMVTTEPARKEDVRDPVGKLYWPGDKGRDGERTPMQWDATAAAGFSRGTPWLPVPASAATRNVAAQSADPDSILGYYRRLLRYRKSSAVLRHGGYEEIGQDPHLLAYRRSRAGQAVVVALNMSAEPRTLRLPSDLARATLRAVVASAAPSAPAVAGELRLPPYAAIVLEVSEAGRQ
jgi:alpha-glucosidase